MSTESGQDHQPQTCDNTGTWQSSGSACAYVCSAGVCTGSCTPGAVQCNGLQPQMCDSTGTWQANGPACTMACTNGTCSACTPNSTQCSGNGVETCQANGTWGSPSSCPYVCASGACTGVCTPNSTQCADNTDVESCNASGQWGTPTACTYVCVAGSPAACGGVCTPGTTTCSNNGVETCGSNGQWSAPVICTGQTCVNGACQGTCVSGSSQCNGLQPQTCDATGNWDDNGSACPYVCTNGTCTGVCAPNATKCSGNDIETCSSAGEWGAATACTSGESCVNGVCTTSCTSIPENCSNGVDDNCNGLIDCADPECVNGGWSCADLPSGNGWTIVAFDPSGRPTCPANFSTSATDIYSSVSGSADSCTCDCTNTKAATCDGKWAWSTAGTNSSSCGTPPTSGGNSVSNGSCVATATDNLNTTYYFKGASNSMTTSAGTCSASPKVTNKPAVSTTNGETCSLPQVGAGCSSGNYCAPGVPSGFTLCSAYAGDTTCASGLTKYTVYGSYSDTRSCGSCSCDGTSDLACSVTGEKYYASSDCSGSYFDMSTSCKLSTVPNGGNSNSYKADLSTNGEQSDCSIHTNSSATGSVTGTSPTTVCCL